MAFSDRLQKQLEAVNMRHLDLAEAVGVSRAAVSMWCSGAMVPRSKTLYKIAEALNCTIDDLLDPEDIQAHARALWASLSPAGRSALIATLEQWTKNGVDPPQADAKDGSKTD